jgi:hypothetical protein
LGCGLLSVGGAWVGGWGLGLADLVRFSTVEKGVTGGWFLDSDWEHYALHCTLLRRKKAHRVNRRPCNFGDA